MTKENIELLARPILHATIFGVAPREIMGAYKFKKIKKQVQLEANNHCMICDRYVPHKAGDWIYTHEVYHVDKKKKCYTLEKYIGICRECHEYIHIGRLNVLYKNGKISKDDFDRIVNRGNSLLKTVNLKKEPNDDFYAPYYLEYEGQKFMNDINPEIAIEFHKKGGNILHYKDAMRLDDESIYYKKSK